MSSLNFNFFAIKCIIFPFSSENPGSRAWVRAAGFCEPAILRAILRARGLGPGSDPPLQHALDCPAKVSSVLRLLIVLIADCCLSTAPALVYNAGAIRFTRVQVCVPVASEWPDRRTSTPGTSAPGASPTGSPTRTARTPEQPQRLLGPGPSRRAASRSEQPPVLRERKWSGRGPSRRCSGKILSYLFN